MKSLVELVESYKNTPAVVTVEPVRQISDGDRIVINKVFEKLCLIFPAWKVAFPTEAAAKSAKKEWFKALSESGTVTPEQFALGFKAAREKNLPFFPSPGMFIEWCKLTPESLGLPSVDEAYVNVCRRRETHPAAILAAKSTRFERETLAEPEYRKVFTSAYMQIVERLMRGEKVDLEVKKAITNEATHSSEYYQETGKRGAANLKKLFRKGI